MQLFSQIEGVLPVFRTLALQEGFLNMKYVVSCFLTSALLMFLQELRFAEDLLHTIDINVGSQSHVGPLVPPPGAWLAKQSTSVAVNPYFQQQAFKLG
jgi:hypothetical protein